MYEDLEQWMAQMVSMLTSEEYERFGPALQEAGLAIAELRQVERDVQRVRGVYERALVELDRVEERAYYALRLWKDAK
jgi:Zn-finger domain-containing protein